MLMKQVTVEIEIKVSRKKGRRTDRKNNDELGIQEQYVVSGPVALLCLMHLQK